MKSNLIIYPALFSMLFLIACQSNQSTELVFAFGPDDSGTIQAMIDDFNKEHQGDIKVSWMEASRLSNEFYRAIEKDFTAEVPSMDVIASDVVWTSAFAHQGWAEDLSSRFYDSYNSTDFIEASLNSTIYQYKIWSLPWYTDAGMLFYRKDLLQENGYSNPPGTWSELIDMSRAIQTNNYIENGYVFQGANYEGGLANACEYVWNAGGDILISDLSASVSFDQSPDDVNIITINSQEAINGLTDAYNIIQSGICPSDIANYKELDATQAFQQGKAVFMRSWPGTYASFLEEDSPIDPDQVGLAPLPVHQPGMSSYSCLGGWNLVINARISDQKKKAAWTFIQYMTDASQQKRMAQNSGILPSLRSLYEDMELMTEVPVLAFAKEVIRNTRVRPVTPYYMEISPDMAWSFNAVLRAELSPKEAVETIQSQFENNLATTE